MPSTAILDRRLSGRMAFPPKNELFVEYAAGIRSQFAFPVISGTSLAARFGVGAPGLTDAIGYHTRMGLPLPVSQSKFRGAEVAEVLSIDR
jgi:hypothetical protein